MTFGLPSLKNQTLKTSLGFKHRLNKRLRTGPTHRVALKFRRVPPGYPRFLATMCPKTATALGIKGTSLPRSSDGGYPYSLLLHGITKRRTQETLNK